MRRVGELTIYEGLGELPDDFGPTAVTVGVFDGLHRGHQALVRAVVEQARAAEVTPAVVTFDRHPLEVVAPGKEPPLLTTLPQRARVLEALGIRAMVILRFDDDLRRLSPVDFVEQVLVEGTRACHVVVGANFKFGHRQAGTIETLNDLGPAYGFDTTIFALQVADGEEVVSSTMIRRRVAAGDVAGARVALDRPYRVEGFVEKGAGRGKGLGFPTANLRVPARVVLPAIGVYVARLIWKGDAYPAVVNVGVNPTFEERTEAVVEVHVLDFDRDLYGEVVEVEFLDRLRDEQRFPDAGALVAQMRKDVADARAFHAREAG